MNDARTLKNVVNVIFFTSCAIAKSVYDNWSPPPPLLSPNVDVILSSEMAAVVSLSSKPKRGLTLSREKAHTDLGPNLGYNDILRHKICVECSRMPREPFELTSMFLELRKWMSVLYVDGYTRK